MPSSKALPRPHRAAVLVLLAAFFGCAPPPGERELERIREKLPTAEGFNVLVLSFDALRADALGVYAADERNGERNGEKADESVTPHLDRLAAESLIFERAYSVAPTTSTSFAAAFTGLLPTRVFHGWNLKWDDTLARRFQDGGYATLAVVNSAQLSAERRFDTGFERFQTLRHRPDAELLEIATRELTVVQGPEAGDRPFFAWIHFDSPRAPYTRRAESEPLYDPGYDGRFLDTSGPFFAPEDPAEIERLRQLYRGEVHAVDRLVGELIETLRGSGLLDKTILVVTSDHGEEFAEHGGFQHDRLTEEHVRIPLFVRHPETADSALRSSILVSNVDLAPTLLGLVGLELDRAVDGRDWRRLESAPEHVVGVSMTGGKERWLSLRQGEEKLILTCLPEPAQRLFDLAEDAGETRDLAAERDRRRRELYRDLGVILGGEPCRVMEDAIRGENVAPGMSDEDLEALKSLGYIG